MQGLEQLVPALKSFKGGDSDVPLSNLVEELLNFLESESDDLKCLHQIAKENFYISDDFNLAECVARFAWPYFLDNLQRDLPWGGSSGQSKEVTSYNNWARKCVEVSCVAFFLNEKITKWSLSERRKRDEDVVAQFDLLKMETQAVLGGLDDRKKDFDLVKGDFDSLVNELKTYLARANFTKLSSGFSDLIESIEERNAGERKRIYILGVVMLLIPVVIFILTFWVGDLGWSGYLLHAAPLATVELVVFYYFRLSVMSWKDSSGQILQLKNKRSCLEFIENYVDFKVNKVDVRLEKFESLIFSSVVADEAKIPSVLDGLDQLANVLKALKSSK
ncbi:hypothetical protein [Chromobacterium haemolyticum]|uniref:hypothetical protein n=1 Tax=Chromobacterium TaxID=535 RepID=UPI004056F095